MKIYLVGGAVRDALLGFPIKERDWVVVGATPAEMIALGYRQVGKEFPVFIHPQTGEEYALARLERKTHPGYTGFQFDTSKTVTLEADLKRRDLTINAMAETLEGELIDPYQGKKDLELKQLRHVSTAFAEDPVRILRTARFLARYHHLGFRIAKETEQLMQQMVKAGEVNALVSERVWKELERALSEPNPEQFFAVLSRVHALPILFNTIQLEGIGMKALQQAVRITTDTTVRFAALTHDVDNSSVNLRELRNRYRIPNDFYDLARLTAQYYEKALNTNTLTAEAILQLFSALDYFRREKRFHAFLKAVSAIAAARHLSFDPTHLLSLGEAAKSVDVKMLIEQGYTHHDLAEKIRQQRLDKIAALIKKY